MEVVVADSAVEQEDERGAVPPVLWGAAPMVLRGAAPMVLWAVVPLV